MVGRRQLRELGISDHETRYRVEVGRLHRIHPRVYAVGHRNLTYRGRWMAAVLWGGPGAVLSHHAALSLWDLRAPPEGRLDVTVVASGRRSIPGVRLHCVRSLSSGDVTRRNWIPVTTLARTLLDYAEVVDPQWLRIALQEAERREVLSGGALEQAVARNAGRHGIRPLRETLAAISGPAPWTQSEFERRFLVLVRSAGLPEPSTNVIVYGELVDVFWAQASLAVELDGYDFHRGRRQFESDRRRDAKLALAGLTVVRLTQPRVENEPESVIGELLAFLRRSA